jgi:hypothetical protein
MSTILYNKSFDSDSQNINLIINFFEDYRSHLRNKDFVVYKKLIPELFNYLRLFEQKLITELEEFNKNDSDQEENYPAEYKNCDVEDSISEYDTDTDDENTNTLRKKLVVKTAINRKHYESLRSRLPVKFKKI